MRPKPGPSALRNHWLLAHRVFGILSLIGAWTAIFLGVYIGHLSPYELGYVAWLVPICLSIGLFLIADVVLTLMGPSNASSGKVEEGKVEEKETSLAARC